MLLLSTHDTPTHTHTNQPTHATHAPSTVSSEGTGPATVTTAVRSGVPNAPVAAAEWGAGVGVVSGGSERERDSRRPPPVVVAPVV